MKKVALYARVSTKDKNQETENQLRQLRDYCQSQGWEITQEYIDHESGRKGKSEREQFELLFLHAHQRKFDVVLFWALDRFSREGARDTTNYLHELQSNGVEFISYTEQYINSAGHFKEALISILASLANQEALRQSERVRAGLDRARASGTRLGRPQSKKLKNEEEILYELQKKTSHRKIADKFQTSKAHVWRIREKRKDELEQMVIS